MSRPDQKQPAIPDIDERRIARRVPVSFIARYQGRANRGKGSGRVQNISMSGALIGEADTLLMTGAVVNLTFSFFPDSLPVEITARVVRETQDGFGVEFVALKRRVKSLLQVAINRLAVEEADLGDDEEKTLFRVRRPGR